MKMAVISLERVPVRSKEGVVQTVQNKNQTALEPFQGV